MKTITTTVYQIDELSDKAKEKARDWYREACAGDNYFSESVIEDAEQCAGFVGITFARAKGSEEAAIFWSGFSSQGDGACFEGSWSASDVKPGKLKEHAPTDAELHRIAAEFERIAREFPQSSFSVKHSGHYSHKYCTDFDVEIVPGYQDVMDPADEQRVYQATLDLIEAARDFMEWIYPQLEKEYEYQNSDEQVDETIRANEYNFTVDGRRFA